MSSYYYTNSYVPFREVRQNLRRTVEAADLPVSLDRAIRELDLDPDSLSEEEKNDVKDDLFAAVDMVERDTQRALEKQTWQLKLDEFPCEIELRIVPVQSVTSVTYYDVDGVSQTLSTSLYDTDLTGAPGRIVQATDSTGWPQTKCQPNAVTVTFVAGYNVLPRVAWKAVILALKSLYNGCDTGEAYKSLIDRLRWEGGL